MRETHVLPTASSTDGAVVSESGPASMPPAPTTPARNSGWTAGRIAAAVIGAMLVLSSLGLLGGGVVVLWADTTQRDAAGYVTTGSHGFSTSGAALVTDRIDLGPAGVAWLYSPVLLDQVRIRVTPVGSDTALFVGIGPSDQVDRYLAGVSYTLISEYWGNRVETIGGGAAPASAPTTQDFWIASSTGTGPQTLDWAPTGGSWTVVVMNADGRPAIDVTTELGATMPALTLVGVVSLVVGVVFLAVGALLVVGAFRRAGRDRTA